MKNWQPTVINEIAKKLQDAHLFKAFMIQKGQNILHNNIIYFNSTWDQNGCVRFLGNLSNKNYTTVKYNRTCFIRYTELFTNLLQVNREITVNTGR